MNIYIKYLPIAILVSLPAVSAPAEDDSCELKEEKSTSAQINATNVYTADKTWRFKAEKSLINNQDKENSTRENQLRTQKNM